MLEPTTPTPPARRGRRRALAASAGLLAAAIVAIAVTGGDDGGGRRLQLVSGAGAGAESARSMSAGAPAPAGADAAVSSDAKMSLAPYWTTRYEVDGALPQLGGEGRAWRFVAPSLNGRDAARMASSLGLSGTPVERDGGWILETAQGNFSAYPSGDSWSINFNVAAPQDARPGAGAAPVSGADAEAAARKLLNGMGVLDGRWETEVSATEIGFGYGCVAAVPAPDAGFIEPATEEDLKLRDLPTPVEDCPPPPPAVPAQHVAFYPVLEGLRPDWSGWGVTVEAGGAINSLYGTWTHLADAGSYPLRTVDATLDELRSGGGGPYAYAPMPAIAYGAPAVDLPAADPAASGPANIDVEAERPAGGGVEPAVMPVEPDCGPGATCPAPPVPVEQTVTITGVARSLTLTSVWTDGTAQTHLVPAYRFTGRWSSPEMGDHWEVTIIALHPDAIAPPPAAGTSGKDPGDAETVVRKGGLVP